MGKYFGTDGIRGIYGESMTEELAFKAGAAFGFLFGESCVAGRDTRKSGGVLLDAFIKGLNAAGVNALSAGIVPTPALSLLVKKRRAYGGVMVSASHNPPEYNGLKLFGPGGIKLSAAEEAAVEFYIDNPPMSKLPLSGRRGRVLKILNSAEIYINSIVSGAASGGAGRKLDGVKVWLDCGFGAAGAAASAGGSIAQEVFSRLGANVVCLNGGGDGSLINVGCGALYAANLNEIMKSAAKTEGTKAGLSLGKSAASNPVNNIAKIDITNIAANNLAAGAASNSAFCADIGFAFDGDADRMAMVYNGEVLDGDSVLYALSHARKGGVVGTVMSNIALKRRLRADGKAFFTADVGDKNILELMLKNGCGLGGEQSGHYIFYPERATGDGLLSAVRMTEAYLGGSVERLSLVPQKTISLFAAPEILQNARLKKLTLEAERELSRVVVRLSGTEPKIRIMAEDDDEKKVDAFLERFKKVVLTEGKKV